MNFAVVAIANCGPNKIGGQIIVRIRKFFSHPISTYPIVAVSVVL